MTAARYLLLLAFIAVPAAAQITVEVMPPSPTTATGVTLRVRNSFAFGPAVTQTGNHFRIELEGCAFLCFADNDVPLGNPAAGTYTFEVFLNGSSVASGGFVVAQAGLPDAPALSPAALIALCLILAGAGWIFIGRQS